MKDSPLVFLPVLGIALGAAGGVCGMIEEILHLAFEATFSALGRGVRLPFSSSRDELLF
jgi:hypothetical protein